MRMAFSDWLLGFIKSTKDFPSLTRFGAIEFCVGMDFFNITRIFGVSSPVRDVVLASINAFDFFSFVFLNGTFGIMMFFSAFVAAREEFIIVQ